MRFDCENQEGSGGAPATSPQGRQPLRLRWSDCGFARETSQRMAAGKNPQPADGWVIKLKKPILLSRAVLYSIVPRGRFLLRGQLFCFLQVLTQRGQRLPREVLHGRILRRLAFPRE